MRKAFRSGRLRVLQFGALFVVAFAGSAIASQLSGAIFTTTSDGTTVNANIYDSKQDVYLNGGPQNQNGSLLPEGDYYFQVTNPPSKGGTEVLLSLDNAECRQVHVDTTGRIVGYIEVAGCVNHATGTTNVDNRNLPVQLFPFEDTPNPGGEYKVYLIKESAATIGSDPKVLIFSNDNAKTDNFKVKKHQAQCPDEGNPQCQQASITVCKFWDKNHNGSHDGDEPLLSNWMIKADGSRSGPTTNPTSDVDPSFGCATFTFGADSLPQTVTLSEVLQTGWKQSAPTVGSDPFTVTNFESTVLTISPGDDLIAPDFGNLCDDCEPTTSKDASGSYKRKYAWTITKDADKTIVKQVGGNATFTYTVRVGHDDGTKQDFKVGGTITVHNPNGVVSVGLDSITDVLSDGTTCTVNTAGGLTLAQAVTNFDYSCDLSSEPPAQIVNTVSVTWSDQFLSNGVGLAAGSATFTTSNPVSFAEAGQIDGSLTVTDSYVVGNLGTASIGGANPTSFTYSRVIPVPQFGCQPYNNTATFTTNTTGATGSASKTVTVCGPVKTGALTMGFWQNKNGQAIISGQAKTGVCPSATWLRQYYPFQDLGSTSTPTCSVVATYVYNIIKAANASGASMNAMLKAQMLATALDVYFSDPLLGTNKIGAPAAIGGVSIDLTKICKMIDSTTGTATCSSTYLNASPAFGNAPSLNVCQILAYAASQSNVGGSVWYGQVKATQELAKNVFDAINNQVAFAP